jgi:hypothetical protein
MSQLRPGSFGRLSNHDGGMPVYSSATRVPDLGLSDTGPAAGAGAGVGDTTSGLGAAADEVDASVGKLMWKVPANACGPACAERRIECRAPIHPSPLAMNTSHSRSRYALLSLLPCGSGRNADTQCAAGYFRPPIAVARDGTPAAFQVPAAVLRANCRPLIRLLSAGMTPGHLVPAFCRLMM